MNSRKQTEHVFIQHLNKKTITGDIKWSILDYKPILSSYEEFKGLAYSTTLKDEILCCYRILVKNHYDENDYEWIYEYRLELIDKKNNPLYQFGKSYSMEKLYKNIQAQSSDIEKYMNDVLTNKD